MNKFMRLFLNYPEMDGGQLNFVNRIQRNLIQNCQETGTDQEIVNSCFVAEWEKLLDIFRYRYSLDVRADVAQILSNFKPAKTEPNFLEVLFRVVLKVDEHLDFHKYNVMKDCDSDSSNTSDDSSDSDSSNISDDSGDSDSSNISDDSGDSDSLNTSDESGASDDTNDSEEWSIPELGKLLTEIDQKSDRLVINGSSTEGMCYSFLEMVEIRISKLEYVIAHLYMIIENLLFCEEYTYPASDYFPSFFVKKKDPSAKKKKRKETCTDSYLKTKLNKNAKDDFAILLTSPESTFPKYISERFKMEDDTSHRIPLKWTGGTDEVRLAAAASGESMLSGTYINGGYTGEKYNVFFLKYHTYLSRALVRRTGKQSKNKKQAMFSTKYSKANRLAAYYLSERIYGFDLVQYINEYIPVMEIAEDKCIEWMKIFAKLMRIPNAAIRTIYADKLFGDEDNRQMSARQLQVLSLREVEQMVQYETTVYYPILMIYALQCMEMICEKDADQKMDLMQGLNNAAKNLKFRTPLRCKKEKLKQLKIQEDLAVGVFYAELLNESYSLEYFETVFGTSCFDEKNKPREIFRKMYHSGSENGPADRGTGQWNTEIFEISVTEYIL